MNKLYQLGLAVLLTGLAGTVSANSVEVVKVMLEPSAHRWTFHVTLKHADAGWNHYADAWRIVDEKGKELGLRTLYHPHVQEQPFTRTLGSVLIPKVNNIVYVEAHDSKHGWSKQRVRIDMNVDKGDRYEIRRK